MEKKERVETEYACDACGNKYPFSDLYSLVETGKHVLFCKEDFEAYVNWSMDNAPVVVSYD